MIEEDAEKICEEIMSANFPNWMKDMSINIQEAQGTPTETHNQTSIG